jgi:hypothetical protein
MQPLPDGTFRYSPRDLVAYLEGDFAVWCERMQAERARAGGAGAEPLNGPPPEVRCKSVEEMRLVNLLCHLVQYAEALSDPRPRSSDQTA